MHRSIPFIVLALAIVALVGFSTQAFPQTPRTLEDLLSGEKGREKEKIGVPEMKTGMPEFEREIAREEAELPEAPTPPIARKRGILDRKVDPDIYIVGPGDKLTIYLWGTLDKDYTLTVTPEGKLLIPTVGELNVTDKTLTAVKREIMEKVVRRYEKVGDVSIVLVGLREFRVYIFGQAARPGSYLVTGVDRISDLIELAGGFSRKIPAATRSLEVRHQNGTVTPVDFKLYERTGELWRNPYLQMGDVVYAPVIQGTATIYGAVNFPGQYELKDRDTIEDLLTLAGGLTDKAAVDSVEIARFAGDNRQTKLFIIDLREHMASLGATQNFAIQKNDRVFIREIPEWRVEHSVAIEGEVLKPGIYAIEKRGIRLTELVERAGGFTSDASFVDAIVMRGKASHIVDTEYERLKQVPYKDMTEEERKYFETKQREREGVMLVDFKKLFIDRDLSQDIVLVPGDYVNIPIKRETVGVSGSVKEPGLAIYTPEATVSDYLKMAEGFTWNADKGAVRLVRPESGRIMKLGEVKEIRPGDTVWVPSRTPRDWGKAIKTVAEVAAGFTPTILSILLTR